MRSRCDWSTKELKFVFASFKPMSFIGLILAMTTALAVTATSKADTASGTMTLAEIERVLHEHPPTWEHVDARAAIAASLDRQVTAQVRDGMTDEERAKVQALLEFYRQRVDAGLETLERTCVGDGVLVVKFYLTN